MIRRVAGALVAFAALAATLPALAEVRLANAWLRPAHAGQPSAMVYVDIHADAPMRLVQARTSAAEGAQLVLVEPPGAPAEHHRVVGELPVAAGTVTRLAYLGSHVRIDRVREDLWTGMRIPLELTFADGAGRRHVATTEAVVRGIAARPADGAEPPK